MQSRETILELPHGLFDADGACHRLAVLRPVTGHEELLLADEEGSSTVDDLLLALMVRLGDYDEIDGALVSALTRGDRQALVLAVRRALYGDRLSLVVRCPNPACLALSDIDLQISELLPAAAPPRRFLECSTASGVARVREPTGADDEIVREHVGDRRAGVGLLWSRLVTLDERPLEGEDWWRLPASTRHAVALALAEGSRAPELVFLAPCPSCRAFIELVLEPFSMLARELRLGGDRLFAEVHSLAFHYHWPESEILSLPRPRRWRYLELVGRELSGRSLLDGGY